MNGKYNVLNHSIKRYHNTATNPEPFFSQTVLHLGNVQDDLITTTSNLVHYDFIICRSQAEFLAQLGAASCG